MLLRIDITWQYPTLLGTLAPSLGIPLSWQLGSLAELTRRLTSFHRRRRRPRRRPTISWSQSLV